MRKVVKIFLPRGFFQDKKEVQFLDFPSSFTTHVKDNITWYSLPVIQSCPPFSNIALKIWKKNMSLVLVYFKIEAVVSFWWIPWPYTKNTYLCIVYIVYCIYVICKSCKSCNVLARATATSNSTILAVKNIAIFVCCY